MSSTRWRSGRFLTSLIALYGLFAATSVAAQDAHYWSDQYGTRAELLGGLVVGSTRDLSASFYNPGGVALSDDPRLALTTDAYRVTSIVLEDGAGDDLDLGLLQVGSAPRMFALRLGGGGGGDNFALSLLSRYDFQLKVSSQLISPPSGIAGQPGVSSFSGEGIFDNSMGEYWAGVSWARQVGQNLGLGATPYLAIRSQSGRQQVLAQAIRDTSAGIAFTEYDDFNYWNVALLAKIGMMRRWPHFSAGLTVTTPGVSLFGDGTISQNSSFLLSDTVGTVAPVARVSASYQKNLAVRWRSPLSIALGAAWQVRNTQVHVSAEWFDRVGEYTVIDAQPYVAQTTGEVVTPDFSHEFRSVTNVGVGLVHVSREDLQFYGAFTTDFSARIAEAETRFAVGSWNIHHVTAGLAFRVSGTDLTLGSDFAFGSRDFGRAVDFTNAAAGGALLPEESSARLRFRRWKVMIGFSIPAPSG